MGRLFILTTILILIGFLSNSCNLINGDRSYNFTTTASPEEGGTIDPPSGSYDSGEQLSVKANPSEGWRFDRWEGDFANITVNPVNISMTKDYNIIAVFKRRDYPLHISVIGEGIVEEEILQQKSTEYPFGTTVQLTAVPHEGWQFVYWEGDVETTENPTVIEITTENNVTAVFEPINYELTITVEGEGHVKEKLLQAKANEYPFGSIVQLTAVPDEGWRFLKWAGDIQGKENPSQLIIDKENNVTAYFSLDEDSFLQDYAQREDVIITESGLMYRILREGTGKSPELDSRVRVHYEASLVSGDIIASTYERDEPLEFIVSEVIAGFAEGIMLMQEGAKYELVIPAELGYGDYPPPNSGIHPGATLIFSTELLEVL